LGYRDGVGNERILIDPDRMNGLPCIRGTRLTVWAVLDELAAGRTVPDLLSEHPDLEHADVLAALKFAADRMPDRELALSPFGMKFF
jgi:uncharacterized protein (DUF433 family)